MNPQETGERNFAQLAGHLGMEFSREPSGAREDHAFAVSRLTLSDVEVRAAEVGVSVGENGVLDGTRVTVVDSDVGYQILDMNDPARNKAAQCWAVRCRQKQVRMSEMYRNGRGSDLCVPGCTILARDMIAL